MIDIIDGSRVCVCACIKNIFIGSALEPMRENNHKNNGIDSLYSIRFSWRFFLCVSGQTGLWISSNL